MSVKSLTSKPFSDLETINYWKEFLELFLEIINNSDILSIWWKINSIEGFKNIKHIVVIWSSLCWKTTLQRDIRWKAKNIINFPRRYVNRERRESPDKIQNEMEDLENVYCTNDEFKQALIDWEIWINWERELAWKVSQYGFENLSSKILEESDFIMYSANNAFVKEWNNLNWVSEDVLNKMLIIWVTTDDLVRLQRYEERNPNLANTAEWVARMKDSSKNVPENAHLTVDTTKWWDEPSDEVNRLLKKVSEQKKILDTLSTEENKSISILNNDELLIKHIIETTENENTEYTKNIFLGHVAKELFKKYNSSNELEYSKNDYLKAFLKYIKKHFFNDDNIDFNYSSKWFWINVLGKTIIRKINLAPYSRAFNDNKDQILNNISYIEQLLQIMSLCLESDIKIFKWIWNKNILKRIQKEAYYIDIMFQEWDWETISDWFNNELIGIYNNIKASIENKRFTILPEQTKVYSYNKIMDYYYKLKYFFRIWEKSKREIRDEQEKEISEFIKQEMKGVEETVQ